MHTNPVLNDLACCVSLPFSLIVKFFQLFVIISSLESSSLPRKMSVWMIQLSKANLSSDSLIISPHCPYRSRRRTLINFKVFFLLCVCYSIIRSRTIVEFDGISASSESQTITPAENHSFVGLTQFRLIVDGCSRAAPYISSISAAGPYFKSINVHYSRTGCFSFNFSLLSKTSHSSAHWSSKKKHQQYHRWRLNRKKPVCESSRESLSLGFFGRLKNWNSRKKHKVIKQSLRVQAQSEELICSPHQRERRPNEIFFLTDTQHTQHLRSTHRRSSIDS